MNAPPGVAALFLACFVVGCAEGVVQGRASAPDLAGRPTAPLQPDPAPPAGPSVEVHVEADREARIVRLGPGGQAVEECLAPCDRPLPQAALYRVDGPEIRSSWPFRLDGAAGGRLDLTVSTRRRSAYDTGDLLAKVGGVAVAAGFVAVLVGGLVATTQADADHGGPAPCPACTAAFVGGAAVGLAGVALATTGLILSVSNQSSPVALP